MRYGAGSSAIAKGAVAGTSCASASGRSLSPRLATRMPPNATAATRTATAPIQIRRWLLVNQRPSGDALRQRIRERVGQLGLVRCGRRAFVVAVGRIARVLELFGQLRTAGGHDAAARQHVHDIGLQLIEQALVV